MVEFPSNFFNLFILRINWERLIVVNVIIGFITFGCARLMSLRQLVNYFKEVSVTALRNSFNCYRLARNANCLITLLSTAYIAFNEILTCLSNLCLWYIKSFIASIFEIFFQNLSEISKFLLNRSTNFTRTIKEELAI